MARNREWKESWNNPIGFRRHLSDRAIYNTEHLYESDRITARGENFFYDSINPDTFSITPDEPYES